MAIYTLLRGKSVNIRWTFNRTEHVVALGVSVSDPLMLLKSGLVSERDPNAGKINQLIKTTKQLLLDAEAYLRKTKPAPKREHLKQAHRLIVCQRGARAKRQQRLQELAAARYQLMRRRQQNLLQQIQELAGQIVNYERRNGIVAEEHLLQTYFEKYKAARQRQVTAATYKNYNVPFKHLKEWNPRLRLDELGFIRLVEFENYLLDKRFSNSSITLYMHIIKSVLTWCRKADYPVDPTFVNYSVDLHKATNDARYCSREELQYLLELQLPRLTDTHYLVRDMFLLACSTGLRISDIKQVSQAFIENDVLRITSSKTGANCEIPLNDLSRAMLARLQNKSFANLLTCRFNACLRYIFQCIPAFHMQVQQRTVTGTERRTDLRPRYELASSHWGRKTFINLAIQSGASALKVRMMTGITSEKSFDAYTDRGGAPIGGYAEMFSIRNQEIAHRYTG